MGEIIVSRIDGILLEASVQTSDHSKITIIILTRVRIFRARTITNNTVWEGTTHQAHVV